MDPAPQATEARAGRLVIRPAGVADAEALWALVREFAAYEKLEHLVSGSAERLAAKLFGNAWPRVECVVAAVDGRLVGYALFYGAYSTFWTQPLMCLEDIFVAESHRGRGVGRVLMSAVARVAVERGCPRLDWAVLDWNARSIEFYERLGAKRHDGWHAYRLDGEELKKLAEDRRD